jgi:hypothetical protein
LTGTPAGSAGEIQFHGSVGQFAGNPRFTIDSTNQYLSLGNAGSTRSRIYSQQQSSTDRLAFGTGNNVHSFYMQNNGDFNIPGNLNFDGTTKGIVLLGANSQYLKMSRASSAGAFRYEFITNTTTDYYIGFRGSVPQLTFDGQSSTMGFVFGNNLSGTFNTCAQLEVVSTTKGLLLPRMTKTQRDAISTPVAGLAVYQTDNTPGLRVYNGTNWMRYTETAD